MDNEVKVTNIKSLIITITLVVLIVTAGTFAWLNYRSKSTAMVLTIGDINDIQITLKPYQLDLELSPVLTYTSLDANEEYVTVTVANNSSSSQYYSLFYDISEIDSSLISSDFKWTLLRTNDNDVTTGNFVGANTTDNFYILEEASIPANTTYTYRVYTWVDGSNNPNIENATFKGEIRVTIGKKMWANFGGGSAYYKAAAYRNNITSVSFVENINIPNDATNWNLGVSPSNEDDVKAWLEDDGSGNNTFALKIGANGSIFANNLAYAFYSLYRANSIDLRTLNTSETTNMVNMFYNISNNINNFNLNLGDHFDTSKVTNMAYMFYMAGRRSGNFNLNLGNHFDTSNVNNMYGMFQRAGDVTADWSLDLGNHFNTSNVTSMISMFEDAGSYATNWSLNLGNQFNTSKVINMYNMFSFAGHDTTNWNLNLGNYFNTSNVTCMEGMFQGTGSNSTIWNLNLGKYFDTSNVYGMDEMFNQAGYNSTILSLNLGNNFNTSYVDTMSYMFCNFGYNATNFNLNLGNNFDMSNVWDVSSMFDGTGNRTTTSFVLDLSTIDLDVVDMDAYMFRNFPTSYATIYVKDSNSQNYIISQNAGFSASNVLIK